MNNTLYKLADQAGFDTHDGRDLDFSCDFCAMGWLRELQAWILEHYAFYVTETCFNTFDWGTRIYHTTYDRDLGAEIVYETGEEEYKPSIEEALVLGLTKALKHINGRELLN